MVKNKGWKSILKNNVFNIIPIKDMKPHQEGSKCKCNPESKIIENGYLQIIHFAFDNRQLIEEIHEN